MNFLLSANELYLLPLTVTLTSILENHRDEDLNIYIFQNDFTNESKEIISNLVKSYNKNLFIMNIDSRYYQNVPTLRWSRETYYRLLYNEYLSRDIDRILYLDCDIIINKNLKDFYYQDLENFSLAALVESENNIDRTRLGLDVGKYYQAGVIIFNLNNCINILNYERSIEIINNLGNRLQVVDQDVINVAFDEQIKEINKLFNNMGITNFSNKNLNRLLNKVDKTEIRNTYIFHYSSGKPWNKMFAGSVEEIWYKYLKLSPFSYLYNKKYNTFKYKILRSGIMKFVFFEYIHLTPIINKLFLKILSKEKYNKYKLFYRKYVK